MTVLPNPHGYGTWKTAAHHLKLRRLQFGAIRTARTWRGEILRVREGLRPKI